MFHAAGEPVEPHDLDDVPTRLLEDRIQTLAGHIAAATCAFLVMVAEHDRRRAHEAWECLSTAHWLNWKCGMSMGTAREHVRVARLLSSMPVVFESFARGQLSYSKVRAISRVCHPGIEAGLVGMAQHATTQQLEQACGALRRCQDAAEEEARLRAGEEAARACASFDMSRSDGVLSGRLRLAVDDSEVFARALQSAVDDLDGPGGPPEPGTHETIDRRRARALVAMSRAYLEHPGTGRGTEPELIVHVDAAALAEHLADVPLAMPAEGTHARRDAADPEPLPPPDVPAGTRGASDAAPLAPVTGSVPEPDRPRFSTRWPVRLGSGAVISLAMLGRLACDAGLRTVAHLPDGTQLNLGRHRRTPDAALRRALFARDVHCRFPGCHGRQRLHAHHIIWWVMGGRTDLDNLMLLCPKHHSAVHDRHWTLTGTADDPRFTRPDGIGVDRRPPPLSGDLAELAAAHRAHGLDIAVDHIGGRWSGDQIDWDCFFAAAANPLLPTQSGTGSPR